MIPIPDDLLANQQPQKLRELAFSDKRGALFGCIRRAVRQTR